MEDNEEFEVEKIVAQRENHGCIEYKIRWKNYGPDYDTWEPESNLIGCDEVLKNFKLQNTVNNLTIKDEVEDGEVSESDSSSSNSSDHTSSRRSKKSKKKKSKHRNSSKSHTNIKTESRQGAVCQSVSNDFGIKVEVAMDSHKKTKQPKPVFTPNFSMGASELLFSYSTMPVNNQLYNQVDPGTTCKQEMHHNQDNIVVVKEEKSYLDYREDRIECEDSDSDSDIDGQLKVVINDEVCAPLTSAPIDCGNEPVVLVAPVVPEAQTDQSRSWRDHQGVFKIRKSQPRREEQGAEEAPVTLARDRWPVRVKDAQAEAFYSLCVVGSIAEARSRVDKEAAAGRDFPDREALCRAVEEGNTAAVFSANLSADDGDLLVLAARLGYSDILGIVLRAGTDVNYENEDGVTPLMAAAEYGHESACQLLIGCGAFINFVNKNQDSAITKAVSRGNIDCLVVLLQHGCDVCSLDSDKGPLLLARQRNLHEMEVLILEYTQRLTEGLTQQLVALTGSCVTVAYVLFPLRVVSAYEGDRFTFEFAAKIPPVRDDECNLLAIFSGFVQDKQLKYCLDKESNVKSVTVNDIEQQSLFPNGDCSITSMAPILDGKNILDIKCHSRIHSRWARMLVIGFRVKISEKK